MTKTIIRLIDKGRPELGYVPGGRDDTKMHAKPMSVADPRMVARDPSRADASSQITATQAAMKANAVRISNLVKAGRFDQAYLVCQLVATQRNRVLMLTAKLAETLAEPSKTLDPIKRSGGTKTTVKAKRYSRFSGSPKSGNLTSRQLSGARFK